MAATWNEVFAPVMGQGREPRPSQAMLGQAIIDTIDKKSSLAANASTGVGKSFAALVPMIDAVLKAKKAKKTFRGAISTETLTLQDQLYSKDLPFLATLYPGFTFKKLMGRTNYLCLASMKLNTVGSLPLNEMYRKLEMRKDSIGNGELSDIERVLGKEIDKDTWAKMCSSSQFCVDNQCSGEICFSTKARAAALTADIVVINHSILATDTDMKLSSGDGPLADGMLGALNLLVVDEGHQLEPVLVKQWTKELTERELATMSGSVAEGIDLAKGAESNSQIGYEADAALQDISDILVNIKRFYSLLDEANGGEWDNTSTALSLKYPIGRPSASIATAMDEFETTNPQRLANIDVKLTKVVKYLTSAVETARENKIKGVRKIGKGLRAAKDLQDICQIIAMAIQTKDGIIQQYGVYGALVDGWVKKDKSYGMTIRLVPLDVSQRAKSIWEGRANVLLSATLTDLTDGTFRYARACVGFPDGKDINVDTPFSLHTQQLVYISPANREQVEGARYSFSELVDLLRVSRGRALILFTSRKELDWAAEQLQLYRNLGHFDYPIYVQTKDANKNKLMESFKSDINSVLLATKSFFVGIDVPGESLSLVALCKFPLPRYSAECKQQIQHWRTRNFPRWYEREALTVFQQAAGRLIRSSGCKGVVALMDFRAMDTTSQVYKTAALGVKSLGSPVTQDLNTVKTFLQ